jgi:hypothetical protein
VSLLALSANQPYGIGAPVASRKSSCWVPVLEFSVQTVALTSASKFPLLCASAIDADSMPIGTLIGPLRGRTGDAT